MPTKQRLARTTKIARESRGTFANRNRTTWFTVLPLLFPELLWPKLFVDAELDRLLVLARRPMSATAATTRAAPTTLPKSLQHRHRFELSAVSKFGMQVSTFGVGATPP